MNIQPDNVLYFVETNNPLEVPNVLEDINLAMFAFIGKGVVFAVDPGLNTEVQQKLNKVFGTDGYTTVNVATFIPKNWDSPGFILETLVGLTKTGERIQFVASSGLGLHIGTESMQKS